MRKINVALIGGSPQHTHLLAACVCLVIAATPLRAAEGTNAAVEAGAADVDAKESRRVGKAGTTDYQKILRKKFGASVTTYNPDTRQLMLQYDFRKNGQLKDFDFARGAVTTGNGIMRVSPVETANHVVLFETGTVRGNFLYGNNEGEQMMIGTSGATSLRFHKFNEFWLQLFSEGKEIARKDFGDKKPLPIQYEVTNTKVQITVNGQQLAGLRANPKPCGRFSLHGGNAGLVVSGLIVTGVPNRAWLQAFIDRD